jgi:outer membrane protein OmpA-like peptidoglycan-associated protein
MAAMAQPVNGLYVGAGAGLNYRQTQALKSATAGSTTTTYSDANQKTDFGFVGLGSVGYGLGNGLRIELEGSFRRNKAQKITGSSVLGGSLPAGGEVDTYAGMVNAAYDFDPGWGFLFPYVGVGAGYADARMHTLHQGTAPYYTVNGDKGAFAAQGFAGFAIPISAVPGLSLTAEYRFFTTLSSNSYSGAIYSKQNGTLLSSLSEKFGDGFNHSGLIGLRYAFGVAPLVVEQPPPPVQPAPSYLVFFDWDKATLTARARQIIATAASNSTKVQYTRIEVNGYTDTSGTPRYNQGLSVRRAQAVAAELVRDGVPRGAITIQGFGETHPLVPTGPGVREPQNRRVEIFIK